MKAAGPNTLAALASSQYVKAELYDIALTSGTTIRLTDYDLPLTVGANTYGANVIISRGTVSQKLGLEVQTLDLTLAPQADAPTPLTVGGVGLLQAVRAGYLDGARVTMSKVFMQKPASGLAVNTNNESVPWFTGRVSEATAGRQSAKISVESDLALLNVQMPRNLLQSGCTHSLFDAGCGLVKATYTTAGAVTATGPNSQATFTTNLAAAANYYALGVITFTSGANNGLSATVKAHSNTNGTLTLVAPLLSTPATGDTFTIVPGCDKVQATCSSKFSNLAHFGGFPYVPVPETIYDGGTIKAPAPTIAGQGVPGGGSRVPGSLPGAYRA